MLPVERMKITSNLNDRYDAPNAALVHTYLFERFGRALGSSGCCSLSDGSQFPLELRQGHVLYR